MSEADPFENHSWAIEDNADELDSQFLRDRIREHNIEATNIRDGRGLSIFIRDGLGNIEAGLDGWTWGHCMYVQSLWVREDLRGRGYGKRLLLEAEGEAIARGCRQTLLNTHSFQAPEFYQKLGYEVIGVAEDYPVGHQDMHVRKILP